MWLGGSGPNSGHSRFAKSPEAGYEAGYRRGWSERVAHHARRRWLQRRGARRHRGAWSTLKWKSGRGTIFTGALRRGDSSEALPAAMSDAE